MKNNDILRRLRYILRLKDDEVQKIFSLAGKQVELSDLSNWMAKEDDENFAPINDGTLSYFLNGLVYHRRGKDDSRPLAVESQLTNNDVLKRLRIAFNLKTEDIVTIFDKADFRVSLHEVTAFFRRKDQKQYRECKDQFLRNFLVGLQKYKFK